MGISYRKLIDEKCKDCTYDPLDVGNWRQQTGDCRVKLCPLWHVRPKSNPHSRAESGHLQDIGNETDTMTSPE